jgi:hypothetical protein
MDSDTLICEEYFDIYSVGNYNLAIFPNYLVIGTPKLKLRELYFIPKTYFLFNLLESEQFLEFLVTKSIVQFFNESDNNESLFEKIGQVSITFLKNTHSNETIVLKLELNNLCFLLNCFFQIYCYNSTVNKAIYELLNILTPDFFKDVHSFVETEFTNYVNQINFVDKFYLFQLFQRHYAVLKNLKMLATLKTT